MRRTTIYLLLLLGFSIVHADNGTQQRWQFKEAYEALRKNDLKTFEQLTAQLQNYSIVHYLRYNYLNARLDRVSEAEIQDFLKKNQDSPLAPLLRKAWLLQLAKRKDWKTFLASYVPTADVNLQCYQLQARIRTKQVTDLAKEAKKLWLVGQEQPKSCDAVFTYLQENKVLTDELRWQRLALAMEANQVDLAKALAKGLGGNYKKWATRWQAIRQNPSVALHSFQQADSPLARQLLLDGLKQLASKDALDAYEYWKKELKRRYAFTVTENDDLLLYIALKSARENLPQAFDWLGEIKEKLVNDAVKQAKLQWLLARQNWELVVNLINSLTEAEKVQSRWQYWLARAWEQLEQNQQAEEKYQQLAQQRDFYGFLASDRLGQPYTFQDNRLVIDEQQLNQLLGKYSALLRARELYYLGFVVEARREWEAVVPKLTAEELKMAATLANQWGWHDRTIHALAKAGYLDDLEKRFPLSFYDVVATYGQQQRLDYAWIYAVIRQESAFQTDAVSSSGALGLMQLMPATAKDLASKHKISLTSDADILVPEMNIQLGTIYLKSLLDRFNSSYVLATAAYNAGPTRAKQWFAKYSCSPPDIWVELIPFDETRGYVQRVMSYIPIFERRMVTHQQVKPMPLEIADEDDCLPK